MESISSRVVKLLLRLFRYKQMYITQDIDLEWIRKDDITVPKKWMCRGCVISRQKIGSGRQWVLTPKKMSGDKTVIYFHGGGFVGGMVKQQWSTIARISVKTNSRVIIPDYQLAPEGTYSETLALFSEAFEKILGKTGVEDISFIGDSAGGGLMLSFTMMLRDNEKPLPSRLVALSPWVDVTMRNPEIKALERFDPMISAPGLKRAGEMYAGGADASNYLISPLYGDPSGLPPIHIFAGTHDILQPDGKIFAEKAKSSGVETHYYEYERMIHGWMFLPMPETKDAMKKIACII